MQPEYLLDDESSKIEYKKSQIKLSDDLFETYSAFANTNGGKIFLGIAEENQDGAKRKYQISGLHNAQQQEEQINNFFNDINKVSFNSKKDIIIHTATNGLKYIEIDILEAPEKEKPVEINKKGSWVAYLREGTSDRKMSRTEYQTFIRNQSEDLDTKVLVDYSIEDLDMHSVAEYRRRVELVKKFEHFKEYSLEDFLRNIGVLATERESKQEGLTIGGLLFFGKPQEINRYFPYVQLDLFDHRTRDREMRWQHRISSISDNINIFNFFIKTYEYLQNLPLNMFKVDEKLERIEVGEFMKTALREALINVIMHADYFSEDHEIINVFWDYIDFENGGSMKVSRQDFFTTTTSKVRNPVISKLLIFMNFGERAGTGGEQIAYSAKKSQFKFPELISNYQKTKLRIWMIDFADSLTNLNPDEATILKLLKKNHTPITAADIRKVTGISYYYTREAITGLIEKKYVEVLGKGRSTHYRIKQNLEQQIIEIKQMASDLSFPEKH